MVRRLAAILASVLVLTTACAPQFRIDRFVELVRLGEGSLHDYALSPDGSRLAVATSLGIGLYDSSTLLEIGFTQTDKMVGEVAWSPDGLHLAAVGSDYKLAIWNADVTRQIAALDCLAQPEELYCQDVSWSSDGTQLYFGQTVWDTATWDASFRLEGLRDGAQWSADGAYISSVEYGGFQVWDDSGEKLAVPNVFAYQAKWSPEANLIAIHAIDFDDNWADKLWVWDVTENRVLLEYKPPDGRTHLVNFAWAPDHRRLAVAFSFESENLTDGHLLSDFIKIFDVQTGEQAAVLEAISPNGRLFQTDLALLWGRDGETLLAGCADGKIRAWSTADGELISTLDAHTGLVYRLDWLPGSNVFLSSGHDSILRSWDLESGLPLGQADPYSSIRSLAWSPDGRQIAMGYRQPVARIWNVPGGQVVRTFANLSGRVDSIAWSARGDRVALADYADYGNGRDTIRVEDSSGAEAIYHLDSSFTPARVAISPDGGYLAAAGYTLLRIWDLETTQVVTDIPNPDGSVGGLAWSPDGTQLAFIDVSGKVYFYDTHDHQVRAWEAFGYHEQLGWLAWSPDGSSVIASSQHRVQIIEADTGKVLSEVEGIRGPVAWSPDGEWIAATTEDYSIVLWHPDNPNTVISLKGHRDRITGLAWSPDGRQLASSSDDGTLRIWGMPR